MGRFVHFDPFQIAAQSTQFLSGLSLEGIRSKLGRMNFGGPLWALSSGVLCTTRELIVASPYRVACRVDAHIPSEAEMRYTTNNSRIFGRGIYDAQMLIRSASKSI